MAEGSLLKIISEKWIKPSSPTPPSSKYHKFSFFDAYMMESFIPIGFFYPKESFHGLKSSTATEIFHLLETSLSKTLTYYYPFAGTFMDDNITVNCNDAGVQLWHVHVRTTMSEFLNNREDYQPWNPVFVPEMYSCLNSHVKIQLSNFECGGICVGISMSHKLGEALVPCNFVNDWAKMCRCSQETQPPPPLWQPAPILSGASIFPPPDNYSPPHTTLTTFLAENSALVTQRFVFSSSSISKLKNMVATDTEIKNPSQTEVVTALIFKSVTSAVATAGGSFKPCSLVQAANFRPLTIPPLSEQYIGNFISNFVVTAKDENETTLSRVASELRKSKVEFQERHRIRVQEGNNDEFMAEYFKYWKESEEKLMGDRYRFTSVIRFPYYKSDFGFGKPVFVWISGGLFEEVVVLIDSASSDGIEAFVTLKKDKMKIIEHDDDFLAFVSLNPKFCGTN